eukprot:3536976-Rhodomonas_salina.3
MGQTWRRLLAPALSSSITSCPRDRTAPCFAPIAPARVRRRVVVCDGCCLMSNVWCLTLRIRDQKSEIRNQRSEIRDQAAHSTQHTAEIRNWPRLPPPVSRLPPPRVPPALLPSLCTR